MSSPVSWVGDGSDAAVWDIAPAGIYVGQLLTMWGRMEENTVPCEGPSATPKKVQLLQINSYMLIYIKLP